MSFLWPSAMGTSGAWPDPTENRGWGRGSAARDADFESSLPPLTSYLTLGKQLFCSGAELLTVMGEHYCLPVSL